MNLMEQWRSVAYNEATGKDKLQQLWAAYFQEEKEIYAQLLKNPDEVVKGTVKELADKYQVSLMTMTGFLDGINDSLVEKNPLDDLEEDTEVNLGFDKALLYKNMVAAEADWLYNLEEWNAIFDEETRKELYKEQKSSPIDHSGISPGPSPTLRPVIRSANIAIFRKKSIFGTKKDSNFYFHPPNVFPDFIAIFVRY